MIATVRSPQVRRIALFCVIVISISGIIYAGLIPDPIGGYFALKEAYDAIVIDLSEIKTKLFEADKRLDLYQTRFEAAEKALDEYEARLKPAEDAYEAAKSEKKAAETAVNAQKQFIKHIKAYLKTLSPSHPEHGIWEQNLHDAEYRLDEKKKAYKDASKKVIEKLLEVNGIRETVPLTKRRYRKAKAFRDYELKHIDYLEALEVELLAKKAQLEKDMAASRANTKKIREKVKREDEGNN